MCFEGRTVERARDSGHFAVRRENAESPRAHISGADKCGLRFLCWRPGSLSSQRDWLEDHEIKEELLAKRACLSCWANSCF